MGFWDRLFTKEKKVLKPANGINGNTLVFTQYGDTNYQDETIQACISRIANEMKKLRPRHVHTEGMGYKVNNDKLNYVLQNPNSRQTCADFLEYVTWQLYLNYNAFIVPYYDAKGQLVALYPLPQGSYNIITGDDGKDYLQCQYNGVRTDMLFVYENIIHLRLKYSVNEVMGGNAQGQPDNAQLLQLGKLNAKMVQSVAKNVAGSVKGYFTPKAHIDLDTLTESRARLEELWQSDSSFAILDCGTEYNEIKNTTANVDAETLKFLDEKILRYYGVSKAILSGDYTKTQKEAFYQSVLEPLVISWGQAFTKALFSDREKQVGNKVMFFADELDYMTTSEKMDLVRLLGDQGGLYLNEVRQMFGWEPLAEMEGQRLQSLNYVDVKNAGKYQTGEDEKTVDNTDNNNI